MKLQPVYPSTPVVWLRCSACKCECTSGTTFADLDAPPGTYLCVNCMQVGNHMTAGQIGEALLARDQRELAAGGMRY